jgi:hypothetical protein
MRGKVLTILLLLSLVCGWGGVGAAQEYSFRADKQKVPATTQEAPSSFWMASDAALGRPLGLAATILGTTLFVVTLPFTVPSGSVSEAGHGLVVVPGGWTFVRPMGRSDPRFEEKPLLPY